MPSPSSTDLTDDQLDIVRDWATTVTTMYPHSLDASKAAIVLRLISEVERHRSPKGEGMRERAKAWLVENVGSTWVNGNQPPSRIDHLASEFSSIDAEATERAAKIADAYADTCGPNIAQAIRSAGKEEG